MHLPIICGKILSAKKSTYTYTDLLKGKLKLIIKTLYKRQKFYRKTKVITSEMPLSLEILSNFGNQMICITMAFVTSRCLRRSDDDAI